MPGYTFTVRKGGCEISLITDDRDAVEQQLAIWVMALSRKPLGDKPEPAAPISYIPESFDENVDICTNPSEIFEKEEVQENVPDTVHTGEAAVQGQIDGNSEPEILQDSVIQESVQAKVEEFVNTLDKSDVVSEPIGKEQENAITINTLFNAESPAKMDFESILEHSVDNISTDTVVKKDEIFCKLVKANNITDRLELLLFTADYFCKYDAKFTFSLKQINGKLMHNLAVIVDHGILKIALDNNYIERSGESEYRLTEYGRSEIYSKAGIWS